MNANELRVGNLVSYHENISVVHGITDPDYGNGIHIHYEHTCIGCDEKLIEPIPLTGKWLLKFGFKKYFDNNNESYFRINDDMFITADYYVYLMGDDAFECLKLKRKIKYIHQLQNLYFAITGEELTIKI